ncbi:2Fe-2S iron-sulfur cluster-binding protein [uncultured Friedmanniella sp.]|uniref:2Fe-2S iron-sulfur cluster-binding protein n=1 Tax=uncultured Friedmanniella sp. TaxID=335381 RepID=UPI0035CB7A6C
MTSSRLLVGGRVVRDRLLDVTFEGVSLDARPGDTLASALLASDIRAVAHSVLLGRPRGLYAAGVEEPNALVEVKGPHAEPITTATTVELADGVAASGLWGQGRLDDQPDASTYDARHAFCEVAVVGAGPAGLAAALVAAASGSRVLLLDDRPEAGGALLRDEEVAWAAVLADRLAGSANVTHLQRTTVVGYYDDNYLVAVQRSVPGGEGVVRERVWRIRAGEVVLATGAHERPLVLEGNDVPGVMLAESVRSYLLRYGVLAGDRVVLFTTHDDAYRVAMDLLVVGAHVVIVDPRGDGTSFPLEGDVPTGTVSTGSVLSGCVVTRTRTGVNGTLTGVTVRRTADGRETELPADLLALSGGWNPAVHLYSQSGGVLRYDDAVGSFLPDPTAPRARRQRVRVIGAARGLRTTAEAFADGLATSRTSAATPLPEVPEPPTDGLKADPDPAERLYLIAPDDAEPRSLDRHFVDLQRDVTVADLARATGAGLASVEHVKRYTTAGTAHDQGKTSGLLATAVVAQLLGVEPGELGTTTYRPPYTPVAFAALAGRERGRLYDPVRTTGAHSWHVARGAAFEPVGQWLRPWFYPRPLAGGGEEDLQAAVARETSAARTGVAFMDGSTLGKIEVAGPDAGTFLDLLYTNLMSSLKVGSVRYGVMCEPTGMILDDGTVFRLSEERFLVTTTTGNAAKILDWMEEWLQTEWPQLRVWCTSVTEQWATMAVVGPRSRELVGALAPGLDVSQPAFPFMTWRDTEAAGLPARVARISFSGELAYEVNVAWSDAAALWDAVWAVGEPLGLTPYGTEAMHVLRAEKGYPIIGQDTDGTVTPQDLGMGWAISKKKADYLGKRSHARPDNLRDDRKHLVGLLPVDPDLVLPEGSQLVPSEALVDGDLPLPPVPMIGHVTSSYPSVALGRPFALALCRGGRDRVGEQVQVVVDGVPQPVVVTSPVLLDPEGARRDGAPDMEPLVWPAVVPADPSGRTALIGYADAFAGLSRRPATLFVTELAPRTVLNLRVRRGTDGERAAVGWLGATLPARTGLVTRGGERTVLALGPDEFLLLGGTAAGAGQLRSALGSDGAVTDVSATRTTVALSGRHARDVLSHGMAVDLDALVPGTCVQTLLAQCAVVAFGDGEPASTGDRVEVLVRSSFADHLADWLLLTAAEYATEG